MRASLVWHLEAGVDELLLLIELFLADRRLGRETFLGKIQECFRVLRECIERESGERVLGLCAVLSTEFIKFLERTLLLAVE